MQHFSEVYPQDGDENQPERNYATVALCLASCLQLHEQDQKTVTRSCTNHFSDIVLLP